MSEGLWVIGRITRPHGVRGELRVRPFTESAAVFEKFSRLFLRGPGAEAKECVILEARPHKDMVLLKLKGVSDRDAAQALVGAEIMAPRESFPEPDQDEYYWSDLIGLKACTEDDSVLGRVVNIFSTPAADVLVIGEGENEVMLPFRREMILEVDLNAGRLLVRPPEGLLEV